ncbi:MAG: DegT/DnrJ/EryC1/StrS family aminotransferase [bacterium]
MNHHYIPRELISNASTTPPGSCPEAEKAAQQVINLPTHRKTSLQEAERVLEFLQKFGEPVV